MIKFLEHIGRAPRKILTIKTQYSKHIDTDFKVRCHVFVE